MPDGSDDSPRRSPADRGWAGDVGADEESSDRQATDRQPASDLARTRAPDPKPGSAAATRSSRPDGWAGFAYDVLTSMVAVLLVGFFLFAISGVWPPLVAVESGSMRPNMAEGDLVFVMEEHRFAGNAAVEASGIVPAAVGADSAYRTFGGFGDVIVYEPNGNRARTPIIHRAMFWVDEGERWYDRANPQFVGAATSCAELPNCPAPSAGFITKGDNNEGYDQTTGLTGPVQPEWIIGTAEIRVPGLGWISLGSQ